MAGQLLKAGGDKLALLQLTDQALDVMIPRVAFRHEVSDWFQLMLILSVTTRRTVESEELMYAGDNRYNTGERLGRAVT